MNNVEQGTRGELIIIGGAAGPDGGQEVLKEVARAANNDESPGEPGTLVVVTAATRLDESSRKRYMELFSEMGAKRVEVVEIQGRDDAEHDENLATLERACAVFFTGGDQLRITSQLGGTPFFEVLQELYEKGCTIAGTSAGAMAMSETMLTSGPSDESVSLRAVAMAPGLNLLPDVILDTHFAERGRIGRLLGAVATNPENLGVGIDEETGIVVRPDGAFTVLGPGAVYVVDGEEISFTGWSQEEGTDILSLFDVRLHVLGAGDCFDLKSRRPFAQQGDDSEDTRQEKAAQKGS